MEKEKYWLDHLEKRKALGQSIVEYCKAEGISYASWGYWHSKLRKKKIPASFVQAQVVDDNVACEIIFPSGVQLKFATLPPTQWILQLL